MSSVLLEIRVDVCSLQHAERDRLQVSNQMLSLTGSLKENAKPTSHTFGSVTRPIPIAPGSQFARERATGAFAPQEVASRSAAPNAVSNPPSNPNKSSVAQASSSNPVTSASASSSKKRTKHKSSIGVDAASEMQVDQAEHEAVSRRPVEPEAAAAASEDADAIKKRRREEKKARKSAANVSEVKAEESVSKREKKDKKRTATDANHGEDCGSKKKRKKD